MPLFKRSKKPRIEVLDDFSILELPDGRRMKVRRVLSADGEVVVVEDLKGNVKAVRLKR